MTTIRFRRSTGKAGEWSRPCRRADPELFVLHPSGNPLYIANEDDNLVTVVDIETDRIMAEIPVGVEPEGME